MGYESRNKAKKTGRDVDMGGAFNALFDDADSTRHAQTVSLPVPAAPNPARELVEKVAAIPAIALTVAEVCTLFNISRSTLHRANLPGKVVIGGSVRYDKNQLLAWYFAQQKTR